MVSLLGYTISTDWSLVISSWKDFNSTFIGAITGAGVILVIEWLRRNYQTISKINSFSATLYVLTESLFYSKERSLEPIVKNYADNIQKLQKNGITADFILKVNELTPHLFEINCDSELNDFLSNKNADFILTFQRLQRSLHFMKMSFSRWNDVFEKLRETKHEDRLQLYFSYTSNEHSSNEFENSLQNSYRMCLESIYYADKLNTALITNSKRNLPFLFRRSISIIKKRPNHDKHIQIIKNYLSIND